jgi:hypothetical protein
LGLISARISEFLKEVARRDHSKCILHTQLLSSDMCNAVMTSLYLYKLFYSLKNLFNRLVQPSFSSLFSPIFSVLLLDKDDEGEANSCWSADAAGQLPGQLGGRATNRLTLLYFKFNTIYCFVSRQLPQTIL